MALTSTCFCVLAFHMVHAEVLRQRMMRMEAPAPVPQQPNPNATGNATKIVQRRPIPNAAVLVMLDGPYQGLFDCFMKYFTDYENGPKFTSNRNLDVVAYNKPAQDHVNMYVKLHPGHVRRVEAVDPPNISELTDPRGRIDQSQNQSKFFSRSLTTEKIDDSPSKTHALARSGWPSIVYLAYYYKIIKKRLDEGQHVLHMDLDAFPVGDPWAPVVDADSSTNMVVDVVGMGDGSQIDAQYVFFRSTPQMRAVIDFLSQKWDPFLEKAREGVFDSSLMQPADQGALRHYLSEYNPNGCELRNHTATHEFISCKTHVGAIMWARTKHQIKLGHCGYPNECAAEGTFIAHTFHGNTDFYCNGFDITGANNHP